MRKNIVAGFSSLVSSTTRNPYWRASQDYRNNLYQAALFRSIDEKTYSLSGPATVLFPGVPIDIAHIRGVRKYGALSIKPLSETNMVFPIDGMTDFKRNGDILSEDLPLITIPALLRAKMDVLEKPKNSNYRKFNDGIFKHNETIIIPKEDEIIPLLVVSTNELILDRGHQKFCENFFLKDKAEMVLCYHAKSGKFYELDRESGEVTEEFILPQKVLSKENYQSNHDMKRFVDDSFDSCLLNLALLIDDKKWRLTGYYETIPLLIYLKSKAKEVLSELGRDEIVKRLENDSHPKSSIKVLLHESSGVNKAKENFL